MRPIKMQRLKGITLLGSIIRGGNITGYTLGVGLDL